MYTAKIAAMGDRPTSVLCTGASLEKNIFSVSAASVEVELTPITSGDSVRVLPGHGVARAQIARFGRRSDAGVELMTWVPITRKRINTLQSLHYQPRAALTVAPAGTSHPPRSKNPHR
jgi:hypothetical protein